MTNVSRDIKIVWECPNEHKNSCVITIEDDKMEDYIETFVSDPSMAMENPCSVCDEIGFNEYEWFDACRDELNKDAKSASKYPLSNYPLECPAGFQIRTVEKLCYPTNKNPLLDVDDEKYRRRYRHPLTESRKYLVETGQYKPTLNKGRENRRWRVYARMSCQHPWHFVDFNDGILRNKKVKKLVAHVLEHPNDTTCCTNYISLSNVKTANQYEADDVEEIKHKN